MKITHKFELQCIILSKCRILKHKLLYKLLIWSKTSHTCTAIGVTSIESVKTDWNNENLYFK